MSTAPPSPDAPGRRGSGLGVGVARRAVLLLLFLGASGVLATPARAGVLDAHGARFRWDSGLESLARVAVGALPGIRDRVERTLGWPYRGPDPEIVLVHGYDHMRKEALAQVPRWAVGVAVSSRGLIVIRSDLLSMGFGGGIEPVLRHEWVHLSWGARAGANRRVLPLWVEEGLAEDIGGGVSIDAGATLDLAAAFGRLLDFQSLRAAFPADSRSADLAYKQSRSWVAYVVGQAGWGKFREVLDDLADHGEAASPGAPDDDAFARSLREHTGRSLSEWISGWRVAVERSARPWFQLLLRDFQGLIFMSLGLAGLIAFGFIVRRRRRQIAALPDVPDPDVPDDEPWDPED